MNTGMLWFDNDPKKGLAKKIAEAVQYYRTKYGQTPNLCMVNPSALGEEVEFDGVVVKSYRPILTGHLWIGIAEASKRIEQASADLVSVAEAMG
jgi:hypothetical protein